MINKNFRIVNIPCINCGCSLRFGIENDVVVEGDGRIICNVPGAVCPDCIESVLDIVADPPGLICFNGLSLTMAQDLLRNFKFLLPPPEAADFFSSLFPEVGLDGKL